MPSILESLPYSIAKDAMYSEALGKEGRGLFLFLTFLPNNKSVIFICQSYFTMMYGYFFRLIRRNITLWISSGKMKYN